MPAKSKAAPTPRFPWDDLSANTLRNVCREIGCRALLTKPNMIAFLEDIEENGVESALENVAPRETAKPDSPEPTTPRPRTVSLKRKKPETPAEDMPNSDGLPYNTRHKGQKRVCVTAEPLPRQTPVRKPRATAPRPATSSESISAGPAPAGDAPVKRGRGRPRKSAPTTSETVAVPSTSAAAGEVPAKRGRGRPRKSAPDAQPPPKSSVPSKRKEVFYGVVVSQRVHQYTEDDDADGEVDDDEDHVVVFQSGETSSLGSSNKENYPEPLSPEVPPVTMEESLVDALNHAYGSTSQK